VKHKTQGFCFAVNLFTSSHFALNPFKMQESLQFEFKKVKSALNFEQIEVVD